MHKFIKKLLITTLFVGKCFFLHSQVSIPELTAPVMDTARVLDNQTYTELNNFLLNVYNQTKNQIVVFTLPSTEDESIEEFSLRVFEKWQLGQANVDNGVLLVVATEDRKLRIEVGYGLEALLTDTKCGLIIRNFITPHFKNGDFSAGITEGTKLITGYITEDAEIVKKIDSSQSKNNNSMPIIPFLMIAFFIIIVVTNESGIGPFGYLYIISLLTGRPFVRKTYRRHLNSGFDSSNDSDSFGSFGGGGFSGGGGRSGGGGASGSW